MIGVAHTSLTCGNSELWIPRLSDDTPGNVERGRLVAIVPRARRSGPTRCLAPRATDLLHMLGGNADRARQLAYLLYQKANDNGWAAEANAYNSLITAWPSPREGALAAAARAAEPVAGQMF